jgi:hypothetical protein
MSPSHQLHRTRPQRYLIRTIAVESQLDSVARNSSQEDLGDAHGVIVRLRKKRFVGVYDTKASHGGGTAPVSKRLEELADELSFLDW